MSIKGKKFTDDGWAIWIDGDDTSTIYFHDWMSPKGKSHIDVSVKIVGKDSYTKPYANIVNNATTDQSGWMTAAFFSSA